MTRRKTPRRVESEDLRFNIETEREDDGRWIAEITDIPGVLAYGRTLNQAKANAYALEGVLALTQMLPVRLK